ncbi:hypothetical protein B0G62_11852 [Paraburkholderia eburnea]|uniref:Uncharacterized protein n=1 Tax=Paraburkholderia eburnea TaxID=1189126 RepID=A0A2S4LYD2_9BURK|nr:hypothetical protein B0G62_11852 [Paraburkholderia eburnea]PRZ19049.1 hypothetical protein BX588_11852 [Paraburkholderia eburnea]
MHRRSEVCRAVFRRADRQSAIATHLARPLTDLLKSLANDAGLDPAATLMSMSNRQHAVDFFDGLTANNPGRSR